MLKCSRYDRNTEHMHRHITHLGSMVPWFQATHFGFHGSMAPPKISMSKKQKFCWVEPWNQGSRLHIGGSMVPGWNRGTMEPKCVICLFRFKQKHNISMHATMNVYKNMYI